MIHTVAHITSSAFFGGPERQMLGLADALPADTYRSSFVSFQEGGRCQDFLNSCRAAGHDAWALENDTPRLRPAIAELAGQIREREIDVLFCHGYKAGLIGRIAARRVGIPVVAVSRGWTYESLKVNAYEFLDRLNLRFMDRVVCVSEGQASKVGRWGIPNRKIFVIPNAVDVSRFETPDPGARARLEELLPTPARVIIGAAGRLSPEKGFLDLLEAAAIVQQTIADFSLVIFGEGPQRCVLERRIHELGLGQRVTMAGFRSDLDILLPVLDLLVQSSHTEGMPNVILEACAAGVPVVATAVGGTTELIVNGRTGRLVPPRDPSSLAQWMRQSLDEPGRESVLAAAARSRMREHFSFEAQARAYEQLIESLSVREQASRRLRRVREIVHPQSVSR